MFPPGFEWDPQKAESNFQKHNVTFDEAIEVFDDPNALEKVDENHSSGEDRWVTIGITYTGRFLTVVSTFRGNNTRIISARTAEPYERRIYQET